MILPFKFNDSQRFFCQTLIADGSDKGVNM
ncbi:unannotated protein [freshwater metagenome]|uniref:Unannotated protein n=1 Tax=freshwater metagenome TaxID=449393 RepID=A0A6J7K7K3_9ZZZZ